MKSAEFVSKLHVNQNNRSERILLQKSISLSFHGICMYLWIWREILQMLVLHAQLEPSALELADYGIHVGRQA